jgi:hypothetical protein
MNIGLSIAVVAPICIYIIIGIIVKKLNWVSDLGMNQTNKLIYSLFFPTVMFVNIYNSDLKTALNFKLVLLLMALFTFVFIALNIIVPLLIKEKPTQASIIQGVYRSNSILYAIPIITTIYGADKVGVAAVCVSIIVPFTNIFCVILLEKKRGTKVKITKLLLNLLKNPIIIGAIFGIICKLFDIVLPSVLLQVVVDMSKVVTPLALILLGAGLSYQNISKNKYYLTFICISKLIIVPMIFILVGYLFGFRDVELATIFVLSCVPTAVSTYVMAKEMGADGPLAGEIVAFTSATSIFTIFLWILCLTGIGLI